MPSTTLTYFPLKGRAEAIRLAFHIGGTEFEDKRLKDGEFGEKKAAGEFTFGSLPVITVDGEMYTQSDAILRYAGKLSGLYPEDALSAMRVDEVLDTCEDVFAALFRDSSKEARDKCVKETMPRYFGGLEVLFGKKDGPFLLGDQLTIADLKLYIVLGIITAGFLDHFPTDQEEIIGKFANLKKMLKAVPENKKVAEWEKMHE